MSLSDVIMNVINDKVNSFLENVAEKYELEIDDLKRLWEESESEKKEKKTTKKTTKPKKEEPEKEKKTEKKKEEKVEEQKGGICIYEFSKPPRKGEKCGVKVKDGGCFCSKHKKSDAKTVEKSVEKEPKKSVEKSSESTRKKKDFVITKNKDLNVWWNESTGLVFKSEKEKIVIGKVVDDDVVKDLSEDDLNLCKLKKFVVESSNKPGKTSILKNIILSKKSSSDDDDEENEDDKKSDYDDKDIEEMLKEVQVEDDE